MANTYFIEPVGRGWFTIRKKTWLGKRLFIIHDIHPGYGGAEVHSMKASKADCEKVLRFLRYCKKVKRHVNWGTMMRLELQLKIKYVYYN